MAESHDPKKIIGRVAALCHRKIICQAEMWNQIVAQVTMQDAVTILDEMPLDVQEIIRSVYRERPFSLSPDAQDHDYDACREIERWCRIDREV